MRFILFPSCVKVIIRRLPPTLTKEQLEEHLQPLPEHDYFEFFANDSSLYPHMFSRAYINFKNQEDIVLFRDRFDGYVFVDHKGESWQRGPLISTCLRNMVYPVYTPPSQIFKALVCD